MPTFTVHGRRRRHGDNASAARALSFRARWIPFLGVSAGAVVAAGTPLVAGAIVYLVCYALLEAAFVWFSVPPEIQFLVALF